MKDPSHRRKRSFFFLCKKSIMNPLPVIKRNTGQWLDRPLMIRKFSKVSTIPTMINMADRKNVVCLDGMTIMISLI
jgi:hypothetical protein